MSRATQRKPRTPKTERLHREEPERTAPVRGAAARPAGNARSDGERPSRPAGIVEQTVESAYRVFADYVERGRESAARFSPFEPLGGGLRSDPQDMATMAMRSFNDMAQMWLGPFAQLFPFAAAGGARGDTPWDYGMPARAASAAPTPRPEGLSFTVEVISGQATAVSLELYGAMDKNGLTVQELRAADGNGKPPLSAVRLEMVNGSPRVTLTVPSDQPPGVYSGVIFDSSRRAARGTLTVSIQPP